MEVVYGDTDSVFVRTNTQEYDQAMKLAGEIKRLVNKKYRRLEIEIDGVFSKLLLLKKKKYAGIKVVDWRLQTFEPEFKGLDLVRRDWCNISKDVGEKILEKVLAPTNESKEQVVEQIHEMLRDVAKCMDEGKVPQEQYIITKSLTKMPQDYPDAKNQVHVQVALRMQSHGISVTQGQEIQYLVCVAKEGQPTNVSERARFPLELKWDSDLQIDIAWYKSTQIHPPTVRLLEPVEGTDAARLAECLGLDSARFVQRSSDGGAGGADAHMDGWGAGAEVDIEALLDRKRRFRGFESTLPGVPCKKCGAKVSWKELLDPTEGRNSFKGHDALFRCDCGEAFDPNVAQNLAVLQLKQALQRQAEGSVQCTDSVCGKQSRRIALLDRGHVCLQPFCSGQVREVFSAGTLVGELQYLEHLCSNAAGGRAGEDHRSCQHAVHFMSRTVSELLRLNKCNWVDCGQLFGDIFGPAKATMAALTQ
jgi:DNA polymerase alpha subunit A